ncbi:F-box/LRR-repeat protein 15 [Ranunculus cassubicifolius]
MKEQVVLKDEMMNARQVFDEMRRQLNHGENERSFDQYGASSSSSNQGGGNVEGDLVLGGAENCDFQHKRAKVHSNYMESHYESALAAGLDSSNSCADGTHNISLRSSDPFGNEMVVYLNSNQNIGEDEDHMDSSGANSEMEDSEARMDLTDDLLHMVLSFLDHIDLCRSASVCKQWRTASAHEDFWKCLNFENRNISSPQFADMCRRYPRATEVNIFGAPAINSLAVEAIESLRNLNTLILGKGTLHEGFLETLRDCAALRTLSVIDATFGTGMQEIAVYHERLQNFQIVKCKVLRVSVRCPQLQILSMKRSAMAHVALNCPQLLELDLGSCHKLSDAGIRAAATSCPLLTSLDISNCSCVTDETLREIARDCAHLRALDASYCPNISLETVTLPMLTVLKLDNCEGITSASMVSISRSSMLEVLELDNCGLLTSVSLNLQHLRNIRLIHCRKFADLNLQTPVLTSITVSNCPSLNRINLTSNSLKKLVLQRQESLSILLLHCQVLQEVDLTECESLTNFVCDVFSDGGGCPILRSLVLDSCESLTAVRLRSTSLVSLSLVSCRSMVALDLVCPNLQQVLLDGCDHLERALFCPVGLRSLNLGICPKLNILQIEALQMIVLELKGCGVLSEAIIDCPRLTSLDASFCSQLTDDCLYATTASCPLVESLILMSCPSIGPEGLTSLQYLEHLTLLDLSYTFLINLQPIFESCLRLKVLKLQACKYLTDSSLEPLYRNGALPALCELDLSYGSLCQSAIEELLACCTHLTHVNLNGCVNMHDLNWGNAVSLHSESTDQQQPNRLLQNLNCVGCPNIKQVVIPIAARCVHLSSLNLSLSANLKEVDIACLNLSFLNLSNCCSLEILKLDCPRLTSLFLQSCSIAEEELEAAISQCSLLETLDVRYCPKIFPVSMGRLRAVSPGLKRIFSSLPIS